MATMAAAASGGGTTVDPVPTKKGRGRRALKDLTENDVNISSGKQPSYSPAPPQKEARDGLSLLSPAKAKPATKPKGREKKSTTAELEELQGRFQQLRIEKEKTEELLKEREELLRRREEEIVERGKEQEKLQKEVKKLQKLKEFKPTMTIPIVQSLREKEQNKNDSKKKKKKNKKDYPGKKKPSPAYIHYCKDQWNEIKKENPELGFRDISNILGAKWKNMSAGEKKPYEEKYQQEKGEYLQAAGKEKREKEALKLLEEEQLQKTAMELLDQYLQFKQEVDKENATKAKKEKDPLKPKHPMSAFFLFSSERRTALLAENKNVLEVAKIAGEEWKSMSEEMKAPYEEMAKKQKEEFVQEMELYKQKKAEEAENLRKEEDEQKKILKQEALQLLKKKEKTENIIKKTKENRQKKKKQKEENSDPNKPKKPASSFILFSKETRKSLQQEKPEMTNATLNALISVKWKELSDEEKMYWNDKASEAIAAYKKEMEEYNKSAKEKTKQHS